MQRGLCSGGLGEPHKSPHKSGPPREEVGQARTHRGGEASGMTTPVLVSPPSRSRQGAAGSLVGPLRTLLPPSPTPYSVNQQTLGPIWPAQFYKVLLAHSHTLFFTSMAAFGDKAELRGCARGRLARKAKTFGLFHLAAQDSTGSADGLGCAGEPTLSSSVPGEFNFTRGAASVMALVCRHDTCLPRGLPPRRFHVPSAWNLRFLSACLPQHPAFY